MIAVIFELEPKGEKADRYFDIAANLRPLLDDIPGFISIERFESVSQPGRYLSLSFWQDEAAVKTWRDMNAHRGAQTEGRSDIFRDYRLRVAHVVRDYGLTQRDQAPRDSLSFHG